MVDAEHTGVPEVVAYASNKIAISLLPHPFRVRRREHPVLPPGKNGVRRCPGRCLQSETFTLTPHIIAVRVYAHRQVQI